jgi:hypothetical protein
MEVRHLSAHRTDSPRGKSDLADMQPLVVATGFQYWIGIPPSEGSCLNRRFASPTSSTLRLC